jgi:NAD(P)-dependent dehydrogenase (short-subunit alcohol dehydrogenase family)
MTNLANSRVIVTGGSAGLGLAMVGALAERSADVTAIARTLQSSARLATLAPGPSLVTRPTPR